jgi:hypothetical protein
MTLVKMAAKILEENPGVDPMEALQMARAQMVRPPQGKRSEAEKAIMRARREWRKKRKEQVLASVAETKITVTVAPRDAGCEVSVSIGKDEFGSKLVTIEPVFTYVARVQAEVVRKARQAGKAVFK